MYAYVARARVLTCLYAGSCLLTCVLFAIFGCNQVCHSLVWLNWNAFYIAIITSECEEFDVLFCVDDDMI